jgi:hypothetical protein
MNRPVPADKSEPLARIEEPSRVARDTDWRLHDISVVPVRQIQVPSATDG